MWKSTKACLGRGGNPGPHVEPQTMQPSADQVVVTRVSYRTRTPAVKTVAFISAPKQRQKAGARVQIPRAHEDRSRFRLCTFPLRAVGGSVSALALATKLIVRGNLLEASTLCRSLHFSNRLRSGLPYPVAPLHGPALFHPPQHPLRGPRDHRHAPARYFGTDGCSPALTLDGCYTDFVAHEKRLPPGLVPIGFDPGSSLFLLDVIGPRPGSVWFWAGDWWSGVERTAADPYHNVAPLAASFPQFLDRIEFRY